MEQCTKEMNKKTIPFSVELNYMKTTKSREVVFQYWQIRDLV